MLLKRGILPYDYSGTSGVLSIARKADPKKIELTLCMMDVRIYLPWMNPP